MHCFLDLLSSRWRCIASPVKRHNKIYWWEEVLLLRFMSRDMMHYSRSYECQLRLASSSLRTMFDKRWCADYVCEDLTGCKEELCRPMAATVSLGRPLRLNCWASSAMAIHLPIKSWWFCIEWGILRKQESVNIQAGEWSLLVPLPSKSQFR